MARETGVPMDELNGNRLGGARAAAPTRLHHRGRPWERGAAQARGGQGADGRPETPSPKPCGRARPEHASQRIGDTVGRKMGSPEHRPGGLEALIQSAGENASLAVPAAGAGADRNETIQRIIDDPVSQQGLRHGVELQRLRSLGTDRPFSPTDAQIPPGFNEQAIRSSPASCRRADAAHAQGRLSDRDDRG